VETYIADVINNKLLGIDVTGSMLESGICELYTKDTDLLIQVSITFTYQTLSCVCVGIFRFLDDNIC